ncbi:MFS transporter [Listeria valentina]|uniref:MFS transporter n=1 Tax=Listeria valentina TaxID=2705293 RepID=UPI001430EB80|nr:MFS transporter [Listeria valentina]
MENRNPASLLFKISVLAISIDATATGIINGAIPLMQESFNDYPKYMVESIATLPNLAILLFIILSSFITKKLGVKKTVLLGMMISFISGIAPFFFDNFYLILASRFLFGAGIGMLNPLSYSVISFFYKGNERAQMYGYISTVSNLASVILTALAGVLLQISWQTSFLAYFVLLAVFFLVLFVVPDVKIEKEEVKKTKILEELKGLNKSVFAYVLCMFVLFTVFMTFNIKISSLITSVGYGSATEASFILSMTGMTGIIIGIIFGYVYKFLKMKIFPIALIVMSISFFLIVLSKNLWMTSIFVIMLASAFSFLGTFIFLRLSQIVPDDKTTIVSSLNLVAINLGGFLAPYTMEAISIISGSKLPSSSLIACGIIIFALFVISIGAQFFRKSSSQIKTD